jgi:decaprenylphospho-beta-D-ribofuranose 2-oxidase
MSMPANDARAVLRQSRFITFDGAVSLVTAHQRPDRYRHLEVDLGSGKRIARGAGLSYAAASFGKGVVVQEMSAFDRLLEFDENGSTIRVEAGASLERLITWAEQKNLYLPVVPGYPLITVGGCVAADVHGKNPFRDGTFSDWVAAMTIFHPARGYQAVTRTNNANVFETTCGGYGLTGLVVDVTLRLTPMPAKNIRLQRVATESLTEAAERLREVTEEVDFAYSWHDGTARKENFGQGILFFGNWTDEPRATKNYPYSPMSALTRARWPVSLWNRATARSANAVFRQLAARHATQVKSAFDAAFPFARQTLYHRSYGRPGLAEIQVLVPDAGLTEFISELSAIVHETEPPLVMMSMKRFVGRRQSLSMSGSGMLFALDLARNAATNLFITAIDALTIAVGAQPNVAKDSRLPAEIAARALPHYELFRGRVRELDPDQLYQSELSRRLEL